MPRAPSAGRRIPARRGSSRRCPHRALGWRRRPAGDLLALGVRDEGADVGGGSNGSPTTRSAMAWLKRSRNSSASSSTTMKRLDAMHDCPLLMQRRLGAIGTAAEVGRRQHQERIRAASSSTDFLSASPAARRRPGRRLAAGQVTAAIRPSAMILATEPEPTSRVVKAPSGTRRAGRGLRAKGQTAARWRRA